MRLIRVDALFRDSARKVAAEEENREECPKKNGVFAHMFRKLERQKKAETSLQSNGASKQIVFREEFVADSIVIDEKDILPYIKGKAFPLLGDDFFYSHIYRKELKALSFIAFKSGSWDCGKLPWLAPALLQDGDYYNRVGDCYYMINSKNGLVKVEVDYEGREGYADINEVALPEDIPATLGIRWSLNRRNWMTHFMLVAAFTVSVLFYVRSSNAYDEVVRKTRNSSPSKPEESSARTRHMSSVPVMIQNIAAAIDGKGVVEKAEIHADTMTFTVQFDKYYDAENFLSRFTTGGKYENGKVVYSAPLSDGK